LKLQSEPYQTLQFVADCIRSSSCQQPQTSGWQGTCT